MAVTFELNRGRMERLRFASRIGKPPGWPETGWLRCSLAACLIAFLGFRQSEAREAPESPSIYEKELTEAEQALRLQVSEAGRIEGSVRIAAILLRKGEWDRAETMAEEALARAEKGGLPLQAAQSRCVLGNVYLERGYYDQAQTAFKQSLPFLEKGPDAASLLRCLNGLGGVSVRVREYAAAITFFERAAQIAKGMHDRQRHAVILENLAFTYGQAGNPAKARAVCEEVLGMLVGEADRSNEAGIHTDLGELRLQEGMPAEALAHFERSERLSRDIRDQRRLIGSLLGKGEALLRLNRTDEADTVLAEIGTLLASLGASESLTLRMVTLKGRLAAARGDWQVAYQAARRENELNALSERRMEESRVRENSLYLERRLKDQELRLMKADGAILEEALVVSRARQRLLWCAAGALLLIGGASVYFYRGKHRSEKQAHDVTAAARGAAESSASLKTRLLRMAAHDLRSPLTVISSGANLLELEADSPGKVREYAAMIASSADKMTELLEDLLSQASTEQGALKMQPVETRMSVFLGDLIAALGPLVARKRQRLSLVNRSTPDAGVLADPVRLWQVFENLISNASKFSPPDSDIMVILEDSGGRLRCGVRDRGPGIRREERELLFRPFARGAALPTGGERSTGLGLSIAKEIVELHHGSITIESVVGQGSTFWVELPALPSPKTTLRTLV